MGKNGGKPFPHSRDTQEIDGDAGKRAIKIFHKHKHCTSLLDDFDHYNRMEAKQQQKEKDKSYKYNNSNPRGSYSSARRSSVRSNNGNRDRNNGRRGSFSRRPSKPLSEATRTKIQEALKNNKNEEV